MRDDIRRSQAGDRAAFGRVVASTYPAVSAITLAITRDLDTSRDVTQDVFVAAWRSLSRLRNPDSFLPWLRQIARHKAWSERRAAARRKDRCVTGEAAEALLRRVTDSSTPADTRLIEAESRAILEQALEVLPDDTRDCVILYYREGESAATVAGLLGISHAAVRKRLERARAALREHIIARLGEELRLTTPGPAAVTAVITALGSSPASKAALAVGVSAVAAPALAAAGALVGAVSTLRSMSRMYRRVARYRAPLVAAGALGLLFGVLLPLGAPHLVWLWFLIVQIGIALGRSIVLPRAGRRLTRRRIVRWAMVTSLGVLAVVWAMEKQATASLRGEPATAALAPALHGRQPASSVMPRPWTAPLERTATVPAHRH